MSPKIALHPTTKRQLEQFADRPSHALALIGPSGGGKTAVALELISQLTKESTDKLVQTPYFRTISPEGTSISIDAVRELIQFLKLKTTGSETLRRFVLVEHAEALTIEAQNSFLKLLEEPPADTLIIMTLASQQAVLPTITSRAQHIIVRRPPKSEVETIFKTASGTEFAQLYALSDGRPGLLAAMLEQNSEHTLLQAVISAKQLLQAAPFERLMLIDELARQKNSLPALLEALERIADASLAQAAKQNNVKLLARWQSILDATYSADETIQHGAQTKLALTNLALAL